MTFVGECMHVLYGVCMCACMHVSACLKNVLKMPLTRSSSHLGLCESHLELLMAGLFFEERLCVIPP